MILRATAISMALGMFFSTGAIAAVNADEAKQLGTTLTKWGAEKAGNKEGTIPEWTGEAIKVSADYDAKEPMRLPNPFKGEKPLFSITGQNMDKYADKLTEGAKAMLKKYPSFRMDVYPTHRTGNFPKIVADNSAKNATECTAVDNELVLKGCRGGFAFPIPKTGNQVMWNHVARFTLQGWHILSESYMVDANGTPVLQAVNDSHQVSPLYYPSRDTVAGPKELYWKLRFDQIDPPRVRGQKFVILDALDQVNVGRRVWSYVPGQRRVKLAPDLAYDTPSPVSGGSGTMDQNQLFMGAQDRYDFKLVGKQEKYIYYNNYDMMDHKTCPTAKQMVKNFFNPDCARWELHRVWIVQGTLKPGFRHILPKRTFYFDEDTWAAGATDDYDASGKMYRVQFQPYAHLYNVGHGNFADCQHAFDLQTGISFYPCLMGKPGQGVENEVPKPDTFYSPEALAGEGIR